MHATDSFDGVVESLSGSRSCEIHSAISRHVAGQVTRTAARKLTRSRPCNVLLVVRASAMRTAETSDRLLEPCPNRVTCAQYHERQHRSLPERATLLCCLSPALRQCARLKHQTVCCRTAQTASSVHNTTNNNIAAYQRGTRYCAICSQRFGNAHA